MNQIGLSKECKDLEQIIDNLALGKETFDNETYEIEGTEYTPEEAIDYLRDYLQELKDLDNQIAKLGNTPELLETIHNKYIELWLFQLHFSIASLPRVIGRLLRYPNNDE